MTVYKLTRILWESYPVLVLCAAISLSAGLLLEANTADIRRLPLILMMIPPINGINNNVCSILGARLASALHMGTIVPRFRGQKTLDKNVSATWLISMGVFWFTSAIFFIIAYTSGFGLGSSLAWMFGFFIASTIAIAVTMVCTIGLAFISFKLGLDPDNIVIPIVTSIGDVSGVASLLIIVRIIGV